MSGGPGIVESIVAALSPHGISVRGHVRFAAEEAGPATGDGGRARSVILLGNVGGSLWEPFRQWRERPENAGRADPLDDWSKALVQPLAASLGATAYFPSDPPWQPFQRWAMRAEGLKASPLGILIHPEYGLWHGYRAALGFAEPVADGPAAPRRDHPCDRCRQKPCLTACPAGAVAAAGFELGACRAHLRSPAGQAGCMRLGCLARAACPVGAAYRYPPGQLAFHMAALTL